MNETCCHLLLPCLALRRSLSLFIILRSFSYICSICFCVRNLLNS